MPGGQRGPANVERLAMERLGLGGAAGRLQQAGQVVEAGGDVRMPGGQRGPAHVERRAVERLGLVEIAQVVQSRCQVVECRCIRSLVQVGQPLRQPATDQVAPAQRVRFAAAHLGEQHVGDGLAADAGVEEERPAGRGVQPFAERLVEEFLSVRGVGHEAAEPVAAGEELLLVPLQGGRGEILGERAGGGEKQAQQRLGGSFIVLAKAQHETVVVAPVQPGQAGFELTQLRHGQRAFAQAFLDDLEIEDHPFAALDQQVLGFGLLRRRQGGQRGVRREVGAAPLNEVGAVARVAGI